MIDNVTGLMWQNNESIQKKWVTQANYVAGNYSDTSGDTATTYCEDLTPDGYDDWRLPSIEELVYLTDKGRKDPAIDVAVFEHTVSRAYWSSTTVEGLSNFAWTVHFNRGDDSWYDKNQDSYVRCVRGGQ